MVLICSVVRNAVQTEMVKIFSDQENDFHVKVRSLLSLLYSGNDCRFKTPEQLAASYFATLNTTQNLLFVTRTGGGKSAVYTIPALYEMKYNSDLQYVSVLVTPLQALFKEMKTVLTSLRLRVRSLNEVATQLRITSDYSPPDIILVTFECMENSANLDCLIHLHDRRILRRIVFDECHCIYHHQAFRKNASYIQNLARIPIQKIYLTATLPPAMEEPFFRMMSEVTQPIIVRTDTVRPNIEFQRKFLPRDSENWNDILLEQACSLQRYISGKCIIFVPSRELCDKLQAFFSEQGYAAYKYHSKMLPREKACNEQDFEDTEDCFLIATTAYGLGVNKKNVNSVILYQYTYSREDISQIAGRASRGGGHGVCLFLVAKRSVYVGDDVLENNPDAEIQATTQLLQLRNGCFRQELHKRMDGSAVPCYMMSGVKLCFLCKQVTNQPVTADLDPPRIQLRQALHARPNAASNPTATQAHQAYQEPRLPPTAATNQNHHAPTSTYQHARAVQSADVSNVANSVILQNTMNLNSRRLISSASTSSSSMRTSDYAVDTPISSQLQQASTASQRQEQQHANMLRLEKCINIINERNICIYCSLLNGSVTEFWDPRGCEKERHKRCMKCNSNDHWVRNCPFKFSLIPPGYCKSCYLPQGRQLGFEGAIDHFNRNCPKQFEKCMPIVPFAICLGQCSDATYQLASQSLIIPTIKDPLRIKEWIFSSDSFYYNNGIKCFLWWCDKIGLI